MIITLVGANFSINNIGTLPSWDIQTVIGDGGIYDGPTSIIKGGTLHTTVSLEDGYEIGSAGVSIIMNDVEQENAYSISGNTITIIIEKVIGSVVISVPTLNTETGVEDTGMPKLATPIISLVSLEKLATPVITLEEA